MNNRTSGISRYKAAAILLILAVVPALAAEPDRPSDEKARAIAENIDRLWRGTSSEGLMEMRVVTEHWTRTLTMRVWSLGMDHSLVRIVSPEKEKGVATLMTLQKDKKVIWNYLPRVSKVIRVPGSMMMGSWMGSHFTNDDLVKESEFLRDYSYRIAFEGEREGQDIYELELIPLPEAAVVWGKVIIEARQEDYVPLRQLYYDEDGTLVRTITFSDVKEIDGRRVPMRMVLQPADEPGESTEILYNELIFGVDLSPDFFSLRNLKREAGAVGR